MCTVLTHCVIALAAGKMCYSRRLPMRFWLLAPICSMLPDLDVGLLYWGVPYDSFFGHRGFFHSITFALLLSVVVVSWAFRQDAHTNGRRWFGYLMFFFLLTASHGFIDAFTDGGHGIAFFSPFDTTRYFMPWTPIEVSGLGLVGFIKHGGRHTLFSEMLWVWLPTCALMFFIMAARMGVRKRSYHHV